MKEKEKMLLGKWYDATDQELVKQRLNAKDLCFELNQIKPSNLEKRNSIINKLLGYQPDNLELLSPFTCDYGNNIVLGKNVFINSNCYFMDGAKITVGDNVFIGPSCGFYTANHPLDYQTRNQGIEQALLRYEKTDRPAGFPDDPVGVSGIPRNGIAEFLFPKNQSQPQKTGNRAAHSESACLCKSGPDERCGIRNRSCRHRQNLSGDGACGLGTACGKSRPHRVDASRRGGRGKSRFPSGKN